MFPTPVDFLQQLFFEHVLGGQRYNLRWIGFFEKKTCFFYKNLVSYRNTSFVENSKQVVQTATYMSRRAIREKRFSEKKFKKGKWDKKKYGTFGLKFRQGFRTGSQN